MTPLTDVYGEWFESLAPEVAKELAIHLLRLFPGGLLEPTLATPEITDGLVPRMRRIATGAAAKDAGTCFTLVSLTELVFESRGDPSQWARDRERLELLDEAREALGDDMDGEVAEWVAQNKLRYPLRAKLWAKAAESWTTIRSAELSDAEIHAVIRRLPLTD